MKVLRNITVYSRTERKRNEEMKETCEVEEVVGWISQRRREWNNHKPRMGENRIVKITMATNPMREYNQEDHKEDGLISKHPCFRKSRIKKAETSI